MPYNMGTLFWQHNDCWPVASWASRDYYGRWKAQHYYVRKAYDDILISSVVEGDDLIVYAAVSYTHLFSTYLSRCIVQQSLNKK